MSNEDRIEDIPPPEELWPHLGRRSVGEICEDVRGAVLRLEDVHSRGEPIDDLADECESILGPKLHDCYRRISTGRRGLHDHLRGNAVRNLLLQFHNDLHPLHIAHAHPLSQPSTSLESARWDPLGPSTTWFEDGQEHRMRFDQLVSARFWQIGFTFGTVGASETYRSHLVARSAQQLAQDLGSLGKVLARFKLDDPTADAKLIPFPYERRFEHLMLDILNEDRRRASMASVEEDVMEKTDIRIRYDDLDRKRGARVQVTSITAPDLHRTKLHGIRRSEEYVFLSPLSLAEFALPLLSSDVPFETSSGTFDPTAFKSNLRGRALSVDELASEIRRMLFNALSKEFLSPLGAMARVPKSLRSLVRTFVETNALASTNILRERQRAEASAASDEAAAFTP